MSHGSESRMLFPLLLTAIFFSTMALWPLARPMPPTENARLQGLQLSIVRDSLEPFSAKPPNFRVELRNIGKEDLVLNLGVMLANGQKQYARAIALILTDSKGKSRVFELREPGIVAGRLDPMIVPLSIGATFSLPVDLNNYWPAASKEFEYKLRGSYSIESKFIGEKVPTSEDSLLASYWIGEVTSNRLKFEVSN